MVRKSADEKAQTNQRILHQSSEVFRREGIHVGIADMMKRLGLTQGGFYRHFKTKDEFVLKSAIHGVETFARKLEDIAKRSHHQPSINSLIETYLSEDHLRHPDQWCVIATLAPDLSRLSHITRQELDMALLSYMQRLAPFMPGATTEERQQTFLVLFSGMAGAISMIRLVSEPSMQQQMLGAFRAYYLSAFGQKAK